ncbi:hypothetical protein [Paramuribaculum intestinale]|jgi:hypothetical protein|uniref:hypothetical protein n=1 Tax=Paramuribaculum intestinale TaxID=2094151 RepID=UPI0025AFA420|nr:hypothetical protein [Paramuribaculum intestinale]
MRKALLFNPENDLALADGRACYTPPPAAVALARAGALLPMWWGDSGDVVMASDADCHGAESLGREFGLKSVVGSAGDFAAVDGCEPWGWSHAALRRLVMAGVRSEVLPSAASMDDIRRISHRSVSVSLLTRLGVSDDSLPVEARSREEALQAIGRFGGNAFIKLPWSSSGRGVFDVRRLNRSTLLRYVDGFIRRQGSVMVERSRNKVSDFAMLFRCAGGKAVFEALSGFHTDAGGRYLGNMIASDDAIVSHLGIDPRGWADPLAGAVSSVIAPYYDGWVGVDMMTECETSGARLGIVPCVEANVRMTMGVVAKYVYNRLGRNMLLSVKTDSRLPAGSVDLSPVASSPGMRFVASPTAGSE